MTCDGVSVSQVELLEAQSRQLRKDLKEMKIREAQTMSDYSELEEENVVLQKQLAGLKQAQVCQILTSTEIQLTAAAAAAAAAALTPPAPVALHQSIQSTYLLFCHHYFCCVLAVTSRLFQASH